ncbi:hypothetical protein BN8_05194 [Fibrisoma limi BUZ 3]|uniref:Uncharacterized protein n=1 Tax=Fibrisoma limi BUZ 3 TaxID=1185876 RepID=I2GPR8_9BACT|nr:hypothetical protein [Fibrisoma limi]CCH55896.1 hypothetical protein BN8_05194 [Fibrisoma limi BUZ 3]
MAQFVLRPLRDARTSIENYAMAAAERHINGDRLLRSGIDSLADFAIALYETARQDFIAMYGEEWAFELETVNRLVVAYEEKTGQLVLQPNEPLAIITVY